VEAWRPATADDLPRLAELAAQAVAEQRLLKGGAVWARREARQAPYEAQLADELSSPSAHVVVGTLEETILGYGVAVIEGLADGGRLGRVTDLYVEPGGREVGIGEALMGALVGWCTDEGCIGVDSLALPGDRATKNFFESFGLVARAIVVHRPLP
jgi:GNAT superfamily N-acetyltransferase